MTTMYDLRKLILRLRDALADYEWSQSSQDSEMSPRVYGLCPDCGHHRDQGHSDKCEIALLIRDSHQTLIDSGQSSLTDPKRGDG